MMLLPLLLSSLLLFEFEQQEADVGAVDTLFTDDDDVDGDDVDVDGDDDDRT